MRRAHDIGVWIRAANSYASLVLIREMRIGKSPCEFASSPTRHGIWLDLSGILRRNSKVDSKLPWIIGLRKRPKKPADFGQPHTACRGGT